MKAWSTAFLAAITAALLGACAAAAEPLPGPTGPSPAPTRGAEAGCPVDSGAALPALSGEMAPADAVSAYLAAGGNPASLAAELFDRGWVTPDSTVVWTDVNGDGILDLAAGITGTPDAQGVALAGNVVVWLCERGAYRETEVASARAGFGLPALQHVRDLTADGIPELIVAFPQCGAHTCFAQYAVFQWDGAAMVDRFRGASDDLPYPELTFKGDAADKPVAIDITATGIGSVGAGPFRVRSREWTWDAAIPAFVPGDMIFEAPRYRIHIVHDADDAFARGEVADALELYRRAIEDDTLLDWPSPGDRREELSVYAAFRRVLAFLAAGEAGPAQAEVDSRFTGSGPATAAYADFARRLVAGYAEDNLERACADISADAREQAEGVLAPLDFGYANRTYTAGDLCRLPGTD